MKLPTSNSTVGSHRYARLIAGGFAVFTFLSVSAQTPADSVSPTVEVQRIDALKQSTHLISMGGDGEAQKDSLDRLLNIFYYDQYRHFQDPKAPYFMFMSRDGNVALGVGGVIRMRGYFDWGGSVPDTGFSPYEIVIPKDPTAKRALAADPSGTSIFMTLLGKNSFLGNFMGYIQAGFSGYKNRDFKLKKAYITAGDWTVGLATTTFEDTKAEPSTVDGAGANGVNSKTNVLVRYQHAFKDNHWSVAGSLEFPSSSIDADGTTTKACKDYIPDVAAYLQYQWGEGSSHVRLSGLARVLSYRDLLQSKNYNIMGWGAQFSTVVTVLPQLSLYGIASVGRGHESYTADLSGGSFDLIAEEGKPGRLYAPMAAGYVFGATYYFTPKIFSNIALSEQRYYPKHNPYDSQYKYGLYGAFNLFWDITPRFEVGAEYLIGKRMNFDGANASANRFMAMVMLSF